MKNDCGQPLTRRQAQALERLCLGESVKEIAHALGCSMHSAKKHLAGAYRRIGARNGTMFCWKDYVDPSSFADRYKPDDPVTKAIEEAEIVFGTRASGDEPEDEMDLSNIFQIQLLPVAREAKP